VKQEKKFQDCLIIIIGDFNGKVGAKKEKNIVDPFGLDMRNDNGQSLIECCQRHNLMISNTWFLSKISSRHTWAAPDGTTKNQIDYKLIDNKYRNGVRNSKARPSADCGSDHNQVVAHLRIKLQQNQKTTKIISRWNTDKLRDSTIRSQFQEIYEKKMANIDNQNTINSLWTDIKTCITETATEVCDTHVSKKTNLDNTRNTAENGTETIAQR